MANPQKENGFLQIANELWDEIIRRDFSKRQMDIILLIWRMSYGCKRKEAFIPQLKDFELCGVGSQNIKKELTYLSDCKVIKWDQTASVYSVNKDYERWQISPVKSWQEDKFKLLLRQNLGKSISQNEKYTPEKKKPEIIITSQNKKWSLLKMRSSHFLKREVWMPSNPCGCKRKRVSKDMFKDRSKDIKDTTTTTTGDLPPVTDEFRYSFAEVFRTYQHNFISNKARITQFDAEEFGMLYDDYGGEWVLKAMRETYKQGPDKCNLAYLGGVLKGYKARGGPDAAPKETQQQQRSGGKGFKSGGYSGKQAIEIVGDVPIQETSEETLRNMLRMARKADGLPEPTEADYQEFIAKRSAQAAGKQL